MGTHTKKCDSLVNKLYGHPGLFFSTFHPQRVSFFFSLLVFRKSLTLFFFLYILLLTAWMSSSIQFSSFAQSCPTLCNPINHSTPGLPVHHQFPEFIQTHVHQVGDAIQPSHPLSSPSPPALNLSQHLSIFYCLKIKYLFHFYE